MGFYAEWWGTDTSSYTSMMKNIDTLKTIIPFWGTLQADGSISDRGGNDHASVVKFAHQNNIKVLLMVNNAKQNSEAPPIHTVLANPALRSVAINNLEAYIKNYNLDGINIDFEMVPAGDKNNLTAFMRELYTRLKPQGYIVSIDVFPKTDETNDVSVAYDYAELAKYADKIVIMAYDNHGVWSGPGPIADIRWVENNLKYALKFIPKQKLFLGVAGYGYDWSTKGVESLEYGPITDLATRFNANIKWDDAAKSPYFNYSGADGIAHTVWFENSESLKYKLDLANKFGIAGVALWKLGEEDPGFWLAFKDKFK
jgi:spore germination protein YaaH